MFEILYKYVTTLEQQLTQIQGQLPIEVIKNLLELKDTDGNKLLYYAFLALGPNSNVYKLLKNNGADINYRNNEGLTLLHIFSELGKADVVKFLIAEGANVNIVDAYGFNPLHHTIYHYGSSLEDTKAPQQKMENENYSKIIDLLLETNVDLDAKTHGNKSALSLAVHYNLVDIEMKLRKCGVSLNNISIPNDQTIKQFQRTQKNIIISQGPLTPLVEGTGTPTVIEAIESSVYFENEKLREIFKGKLADIYFSLNDIKPLFDVMALSAMGHHDAGINKNKRFKVIVASEGSISRLKVLTTQETSGLYISNQNTAFAASGKKGISLSSTLGTILHESTHFVMNEVFKNNSHPFFKDDLEAKKEWEAIIDDIASRYQGFSQDDVNSKKAYRAIESVFTNYKPSQYSVELAVKIPEIIAELGVETSKRWLGSNVLNLVKFYKQRINPQLRQYLKSHNAYEKLESSDAPDTKQRTTSSLEIATEQNNIDEVKQLLSSTAFDKKEIDSALVTAFKKNNNELITTILNSITSEHTPFLMARGLLSAIENNNMPMFRHILENWASQIPVTYMVCIITDAGTKQKMDYLSAIFNLAELSVPTRVQALIEAINNGLDDVANFIWNKTCDNLSYDSYVQINNALAFRFAAISDSDLESERLSYLREIIKLSKNNFNNRDSAVIESDTSLKSTRLETNSPINDSETRENKSLNELNVTSEINDSEKYINNLKDILNLIENHAGKYKLHGGGTKDKGILYPSSALKIKKLIEQALTVGPMSSNKYDKIAFEIELIVSGKYKETKGIFLNFGKRDPDTAKLYIKIINTLLSTDHKQKLQHKKTSDKSYGIATMIIQRNKF